MGTDKTGDKVKEPYPDARAAGRALFVSVMILLSMKWAQRVCALRHFGFVVFWPCLRWLARGKVGH
jgi:hypothetical protein